MKGFSLTFPRLPRKSKDWLNTSLKSIGLENFDICFCVTFEHYYSSFILEVKLGPPPTFEAFPIFSNNLRFYSKSLGN